MSGDPLRAFDGIVRHLRLEGAATGPLAGTTFVAKDLYDVRGYRTGAGNPDWERTHEPAAATAPAIERLLAAGATLIGKSCTDELAFSLDGINVHYGTPQWVQGYSLLPEDLQMIVRTFGSAFPETSIWESAAGDFLLLGRAEPEPIDPRRVAARLKVNPAAARDLARIGISGWDGVLTHLKLGEADVRRYADGAPLNTDDRLRLEFSAPRALYLDTFKPNWELMRKFKTAEGPAIAR
jgi:Amidase